MNSVGRTFGCAFFIPCMDNNQNLPFIIIGQGVAGTLMAFELERRGVPYKIIDSGVNHSSSVAAGIMNPVVFRRLTLSWMVEECWPLIEIVYGEIESLTGVKFLFKKPMRRLFASEQEKGFWQEKTNNLIFSKYISLYPEDEPVPEYARNTFGQGLVKEVYHIDVEAFLRATRQFFVNKGVLELKDVNNETIDALIQDPEIAGLIFCLGYRNFQLKIFQDLPVQTTKGQILTIATETLSSTELLNRKCFLLPIQAGKFRCGATYEWDDTSLNTTEEGRRTVEEKLESLINQSFETIGQDAGIRPTTPDRRPIIGQHENFPKAFLLNGLGTKGYMLAPWCAQHLAEFIFDGKELSSEVSIKRFKKS